MLQKSILRKQKPSTDEISVLEIFQSFWKEKILILIISLLFSCFFGLSTYYYKSYYEINIPVLVKTKLKLNLINKSILDTHFEKLFIFNSQPYDVKKLEFNIGSPENVLYFFQQNNNKFGDFKYYLEQSNISAKDFFFKNFKIIDNGYFLQYPEELNGELFLTEYVTFLFKQYQIAVLNKFKKQILSDISNYEINSDILNKIYFKEYIIGKNKKFTGSNEDLIIEKYNKIPKFSFDRDIVNLNISTLKELLIVAGADTFIFDFEPIIELNSSKSIPSSSLSIKNFALIGLMFGFFLALIIVFFKNLIKKN